MPLATSPPPLDVRDVSKRYGRTQALDRFTLQVDPGEIVAITGPNGAGKTTALRIITGLNPPTHGTVLLSGLPHSDPKSRVGLGFAPDDLSPPGHLTGREFLRFHDAMRGRADTPRALTLAEVFEVGEALDRPIADYSHGMTRKIQVIGAVMHAPTLLVLDEPFRGLDAEAAASLRSLLLTLRNRGTAVLVATHDLPLAERMMDRVLILSRGVIVEEGTPEAVVRSRGGGSLEEAFLLATGPAERRAATEALLAGLYSEGQS